MRLFYKINEIIPFLIQSKSISFLFDEGYLIDFVSLAGKNYVT